VIRLQGITGPLHMMARYAFFPFLTLNTAALFPILSNFHGDVQLGFNIFASQKGTNGLESCNHLYTFRDPSSNMFNEKRNMDMSFRLSPRISAEWTQTTACYSENLNQHS
jgi:hypothetical protein